MKIVIDLQSLQGNNRNRGIGRYSLAISQAILRQIQHHEVYLCLNNNDIEAIEKVRSSFEALIPADNIKVFEIPKKEIHTPCQNSIELKIAEKIRENFIANLNPDLVYISSIFEIGKGDTPISIGELNKSMLNTVTLYDLIPFIFSQSYLKDYDTRNHMFQKIQFLKKSDLILTISDSAAKEAKNILGIPSQSIINCSVGVDSKFKIIEISYEKQKKIKALYGIKKEFIFYLGGLDFRKNINGLLTAYTILPSNIRKNFQLLIIVSDVTDSVKPYLKEFTQRYNLDKEEIVLLNRISEDNLIILYNLCSLFVFPSLHEGFGLPILEAMACGAPTIASNTSSMPEAVGCNEALFNPKDPQSIANKIHEVLTNKNIQHFFKEHAKNQVKNFTWEKTAKKALTAFEDVYSANQKIKNLTFYTAGFDRKKMAFVSPLPSARTGIADYSAQLLPDLAIFYDITLITTQKSIDDNWLNANFSIQDDKWFIKHANSFDVIIYQFGNSHYHYFMLQLLNLYPGIVVLHDFFLSGLYQWADVIVEKEQYIFYRSIYYSHGFPALFELKNKDRRLIIEDYPCNLAVLKRALGIIVLSQHTIDLALYWYGPNIVSKFSLANAPHLPKEISPLQRKETRRKLGFNENDFLICTFGFIGDTKQCHRTILACSDPILSSINFHLVFVGGKADEEYNQLLFNLIKKNKLEKKIKFIGFTSLELFKDYLISTDIAIQLRTKSRGETSACILNCLSYGIPTIVNAHGSINEIKDNVVVKLKDEFSDDELTKAVFNLYTNNNERDHLSKKSLHYIEQKHHPLKISKEYVHAIENFYNFDNTSFRERYLLQKISSENFHLINKKKLLSISSIISSHRLPLSYPQFLIDISSINLNNTHSVTSFKFVDLLRNLLTFSINGLRVEAVYYNNILNRYCYATSFATNLLNLEDKLFGDIPIDIFSHDILFIGNSIYEEIDINNNIQTLNAKGIKIFYLISNESLLNKHETSEQDNFIFQSNMNKILKFNQGFICIGDQVFYSFINYLNKYSISKNEIIKIAKISSIDYSTLNNKLKKIIFHDEWDTKLRLNNDNNLNSIFSKDSRSEIA
ncbi:MAG: glycosyltransferase [Candidatus Aquirickettsiella sp.]